MAFSFGSILFFLILILSSCIKETGFIVENKVKASKLRLKQSPQLGFTFDNFSSDLVVEITDDEGNIDTQSNKVVSIAFENDASSGNASISGTLQVQAVNGVATFNDLSIDYPGSNYTLKVTSEGLATAITQEFDIKNWGVQYGTVTTPISSWGQQTNNLFDRCEFGAIDSDGYVYCGGYTDGDFITENAGSGTKDVFYVKIDPNTLEQVDSFQLGKDAESSPLINSLSGNEELRGIEVDSDGNIYLVGFTNSNLAETAQGNDIFVIKLDKNKNILWVNHYGNTTKVTPSAPANSNLYNDYAYASSIDDSGNLYFAGMTGGDFIVTSYSRNSNYPDGVVVKLDPDGETVWAKQFGENLPSDIGDSYSKDIIRDVVVKGGYVYFAGDTTGDWIEDNINAIQKQDVFFGKISATDGASDCSSCYLNQVGTQSQAAYSFIINAGPQDLAFSIDADNEGNAYVAGYTRGNYAVAKVLGNEAGSGDPFDPFVIKANSTGTLQWAYQSGEANLPTPCDPLPVGPTPCSTDKSELISKIVTDSESNSYLLFRTQADQYVDQIVGDTYDSMILILDKDGNPVGENLGVYQFSSDRLYPLTSNSGDEIYFDMIFKNNYMYVFGITTSNIFENSTGSNDSVIFRQKMPLQ